MIIWSFKDNAGVVNGEKLLTYELCWFIWPLVDECFESLLHGVDKLVVLHEADVDDVIHLVFKIQQLLHHCFVFFWIDYDCASKSLKVEFKGNGKTVTNRICKITHHASSSEFRRLLTVDVVIPLYTLSSVAAGPEHHFVLDWRADREETDPEFCSHPADESTLEVSHKRKSEIWPLLGRIVRYQMLMCLMYTFIYL